MLFLIWTFIDIVERSDKMLAKFEKRAYAGSERVWVGKYRNLHNIAHWHMEHELIACAEGNAKVMLDILYHGFGVKSIQNAAAKYGGTATITTREGWFELRVLIPLGQPQQK